MSDWLTWQIVDSAFPTGVFAHSWGLESAWQQGEVHDAGTLRLFVEASIRQAGYASLPLVNDGYRSPGQLVALDELADAFLLNTVANRASRIQGRTLLRTAGRIWPSEALAALQTQADGTCAHIAPLTGATFRIIGLSLPAVQKIVLYGTARGVLSAAVRLGLVGSFEAQRIQYECGSWLDRIAECCGALSIDDLAQTAPVLDLLQAGHDRLYSRLFQS
jgi:urease accessory protein